MRLGLLGSSSNAAEDEMLQILITEASDAMAQYWGWPLGRQQYQLRLAGDGGCRLLLPRWPIDPESVAVTIDGAAVTDFVVVDKAIGLLYLGGRWTRSTDHEAPLNIVVTWRAGWVLPDQVKTWSVGALVAAGGWVRPSTPALSPHLFEVTAGGTLAGTEPDWAMDAPDVGDSITLGGGAAATARDAEELPPVITSLAYVEVFNRKTQGTRAPGVAGMSAEGWSEQYFATHTEVDLAPAVKAGLDRMSPARIA